MELRLIRNATLLLTVNGRRLLVDPYLAGRGMGRSYAGERSSPLVDLPMPVGELLAQTDAVFVSHLHSDHFDDAAREALPKDIPLLCPRPIAAPIQAMGFCAVVPVDDAVDFHGAELALTAGRHGPDEVLGDLGDVHGFTLTEPGGARLYWAGDTVLCDDVRAVLARFGPDAVVVHAAGAHWAGFEPIVMDAAQVLETVGLAPQALVIATHLDAVDHATVTRASLAGAAAASIAAGRLLIPADGQAVTIGARQIGAVPKHG